MSVHVSVHAFAPAGERSKRTEAMPAPASAAVVPSVTVPDSAVAGVVTVPVGAVLSTRKPTIGVGTALPAAS